VNRSRKSALRWIPVVLFGVALVLFLVLFLRYHRKPQIHGLDRVMASSGERIEITGRSFGEGLDGSKLFIGGRSLTSTGIIEWTDERIVARVPRYDGAVLVKVKTRSGRSNGVVLGDATRFPRVEYGPWLPGAPFIEYIEPSIGGPGTLVTVHGDGFGHRRGGGRIWVNRSDEATLLGTEEPDLSRYVEAGSIRVWSDTRLEFWVPPGASTGNLYLLKGGRFSNPAALDVTTESGRYVFGAARRWSIRQDVVVDRIGAFPGNRLYIHLPTASPGPGQDPASILEPPKSDGMSIVRLDEDLTTYRLDELEAGDVRELSRQIVVDTRPVRTEVDPGALAPYDSRRPETAAALTVDAAIRPDLVPRTAARVVGNLRDDWSKSRAVFDYVQDLLSWSDTPPSRVISDYISTGEADSEGYSFLFCSLARAADVPARPVGGVIVTDDRVARTWWWAEVWIEGVGWVPMDPALADRPDILLPGREFLGDAGYFGGLEGRHIAFSRGILQAGTTQPDPDRRRPEGPYTLQNAWEEASGNLDSYASHWRVPRVTAVYDTLP